MNSGRSIDRRPIRTQFVSIFVFIATFVLNAATAAEQPSGGKHCLWRITDAKASVYLLGSCHALRASDYPLPAVIENAIQQSQQFFFECDPKEDVLQTRKWVAAAQYPSGVQIKGKIKPETYKFLMKITKSGMNVWQHLKPWAIAFFILEHPGYERVRSAYGIDNYVERKARARKCPMYGLETVDEHVNALAGMTEFESEVYLLEALVLPIKVLNDIPRE
jgi:uncharacterized protein YbaP (TraB family)